MNRKKCVAGRSSSPRGKLWVFEYQNPLNRESDGLFERLARDPRVTRFIIGFELGALSGGRNIQGYAEFVFGVRMSVVQGLWRCTWSLARGTPLRNYMHCSKSGNYRTFGDFSLEIAKVAKMQARSGADGNTNGGYVSLNFNGNLDRSAAAGEAAGSGSRAERRRLVILPADGAQMLVEEEETCGSRDSQEILSGGGGASPLVKQQHQHQQQHQQNHDVSQAHPGNLQGVGPCDRRAAGDATKSKKEHEEEMGYAIIVNHLLDPDERYGTMVSSKYVRNKRQLDQIVATFRELQIRHEFFAKLCDSRLRPWQSDCVQHVFGQDCRKICWYADFHGNTGKSFLSRIFTFLYQFDALDGICAGRDITMLISDNPRGFVFDVNRANANEFSYQTLESIKNGSVMTGKYRGLRRVFNSVPVVVFANFEPDQNQLSIDRWCIHIVDAQDQLHHSFDGKNSSPSASSNDSGILPPDGHLMPLPVEPVPPPELPAVLKEASQMYVAAQLMSDGESRTNCNIFNNNAVAGVDHSALFHAAGADVHADVEASETSDESVVAPVMHVDNVDQDEGEALEEEGGGEKYGTLNQHRNNSRGSAGGTDMHWGEFDAAAELQQQSVNLSLNDSNQDDENQIDENNQKERLSKASPKTPSFIRFLPRNTSTPSVSHFLTCEKRPRLQEEQPDIQLKPQTEQKIQHNDGIRYCRRAIVACGADVDVNVGAASRAIEERHENDSGEEVLSGASETRTRKTTTTETASVTTTQLATTATGTTDHTRQKNAQSSSHLSSIREVKTETFRQTEEISYQSDDSVTCSEEIDVPLILSSCNSSERSVSQQQEHPQHYNTDRSSYPRYLEEGQKACKRPPSAQQVRQKHEQVPSSTSAAALINACSVDDQEITELSLGIGDDDFSCAMEIGEEGTGGGRQDNEGGNASHLASAADKKENIISHVSSSVSTSGADNQKELLQQQQKRENDLSSSPIRNNNYRTADAVSVRQVNNSILQAINLNAMISSMTDAAKTDINAMIGNEEKCRYPATRTGTKTSVLALGSNIEERAGGEGEFQSSPDAILGMEYDSDEDSHMTSLLESDYLRGKSVSAEKKAKELAWLNSDYVD